MARYQSEFTQFMDDFLAKNPEVEQERTELRLTWWDKDLDLEEQKRWKESKVPQQAYVYQSK